MIYYIVSAETEYDSVCVHFCDETKENALETTSGTNKSYCNGWFNQRYEVDNGER